MKQLFKITLGLALIASASMVMTSCGSSKKATAEKGYEEVQTFCSGPEYRTGDGIMRANASGNSNDMEISRDKAMTNARNRLSQQMEVFVSNLTDYYKKETDFMENSNMEKRFEELIREVSNNKLQVTYPICEKTTRNDSGNYISYVAVELGGEEFMEQSANRLSADEELKVDYDYEKFKSSYEKAMEQLEKDRDN
jgi:hypothetical protein